ncbi:helix-turn-helix domain-containing protein [Streptomyces sp. NRRL S-813]|uniref:helix-turn-helix domain-containing protein n=1 Tax=Streptomyces sp. NRRL S-813 TaxID=1463919 RepID=UPI000D1B82F3|nr:helix-turn-helix transcriptional regulator [Streptomyces sp. NRRL S-813]
MGSDPTVSRVSRSTGLDQQRRRELGKRSADLRTAARYSQEAFCAATGLSSSMQRIETGEADPRYRDLLRITAVLDTGVSVLVD